MAARFTNENFVAVLEMRKGCCSASKFNQIAFSVGHLQRESRERNVVGRLGCDIINRLRICHYEGRVHLKFIDGFSYAVLLHDHYFGMSVKEFPDCLHLRKNQTSFGSSAIDWGNQNNGISGMGKIAGDWAVRLRIILHDLNDGCSEGVYAAFSSCIRDDNGQP